MSNTEVYYAVCFHNAHTEVVPPSYTIHVVRRSRANFQPGTAVLVASLVDELVQHDIVNPVW